MRTLVLLLTSLVCCATASAQQRTVTLELEDGTVINGPVLEIYKTRLVVEVGGERRVYNSNQWRSCRFQNPKPVADGESIESEMPATGSAGEAEARAVAQPDGEVVAVARPVAKHPRASSAANGRGFTSAWQARREALQQDYPWLFPSEGYQWVSLAAMLFALVSLASHFSARLSSPDPVGFGPSLGFAACLLVGATVETAFVPLDSAAMTVAMGGSAVLVVILNRLCYPLSVGGSVLATLLFALQCGIGYAVLQLLDSTLRQIGSSTVV